MLFRRDPGPGEGHKCMGKGVIRVRTLAPFIILKRLAAASARGRRYAQQRLGGDRPSRILQHQKDFLTPKQKADQSSERKLQPFSLRASR